jgi:PAS domain S-box-containing protein
MVEAQLLAVSSEHAGTTAGAATNQRGEKLPRWIFGVVALIVGVTLCVTACIYLGASWMALSSEGSGTPDSGINSAQRTELIRSVGRLRALACVAVFAGGVVVVWAVITGVKRGERAWAARLKTQSSEALALIAGLRAQVAERSMAEGQLLQERQHLETQAANLSRSNDLMLEELNRRKQAEKALSQQRQELVRSKDVLELHVQARTQELQKLQRRYELILNSAGEGICGVDPNGKITFVNPTAASLVGWTIADVIGRDEAEVFSLIPGNGAGDAEAADDPTPREVVLKRRDGSKFAAEYVRSPIRENGRVFGDVILFKDISERKQTEDAFAKKAAELTRSNSELEQFAFVASHDLQEPLRKIQAFGDRLKIKCESLESKDAKDYLERMQSAAARMQTLINDLLTFSRVIRSSQPFVPVDMNAITREVLGDLEVRIEKTGAKICLGQLPTVHADPTQMRQLMQNLISNALKFQPAKSTPVVKIEGRIIDSPQAVWSAKPAAAGQTATATMAPAHVCELTIQDNGIGFDEKYVDKIFAVFQRLHGRTEYEGTGVGLAVCRRITDRHGGTIVAKSKPGEGATFIVTLPAQPAKVENQ